MKSKRGVTPAVDELMTATPPQWMSLAREQTTATTDSSNASHLSCVKIRQPVECKRVPSPIIADKASFLYRLLEFGQNKKVPLSLPKTTINCELSCDDPPLVHHGTSGHVAQSSNEVLVENTSHNLSECTNVTDSTVKDEGNKETCDKRRELLCEIKTGEEESQMGTSQQCHADKGSLNADKEINAEDITESSSVGKTNIKEVCAIVDENIKKDEEKVQPVETKHTFGNTRESPPRKVSFKVRGNNTTSRRGKVVESRVTLSSNTVAALTTKFNALINDNDATTRKIDSDCKTVVMIPQSKKQTEIKVILSRKNSSVKKEGSSPKNTLVKKQSLSFPTVQTDDTTKCNLKDMKRKISITYRPSVLGTRSGNVRAAIQIFEQNASQMKAKNNDRPGVTHDVTRPKVESVVSKNTEDCQSASKTLHSQSLRVLDAKSTYLNGGNESKEECGRKSVCNDVRKVIVKSSELTEISTVEIQPDILQIPLECSSKKPDLLQTPLENDSGATASTRHSDTNNSNLSSRYKHCEENKIVTEEAILKEESSDHVIPEQVLIDRDDPSGVLQKDSDASNITVITVIDNVNADVDKAGNRDSVVSCEHPTTHLPVTGDHACEVIVKEVNTSEISNDVGQSTTTEVHLISDTSVSRGTDNEEGHYKELVDNMKPNHSFLWRGSLSKAPPLPPKKPLGIPVEHLRYRAVPPPPPPPPPPSSSPPPPTETQEKPKEQEISETFSAQDDIYDDIRPAPSVYSANGDPTSHNYSTVEDNTYDDVGYRPPEGKKDDADPENGYEYCSLPAYDDCEGEGYQFIGDGAVCEEEDIYDDVKSVTTLRISDETTSISNCYESIYGGRRIPERCNSSSASSSSRSAHGSSCDQSNSLYGVGGSQASTVSEEYGPMTHEVWSYQLTAPGPGGGPGQPRSETSDEWVDVEDSEMEESVRGHGHTIVVVQERPRSRRSPSWSRKVRNQWSKSRSEDNADSGDNSSDSDDHHYEMLEDVTCNNGKSDAATPDNVYDDFDSFDSDDSEDNTYTKPPCRDGYEPGGGRLPEPPPGQNIYGITKIAEVAGKKMLELGRSLRRIGPKRTSGNSEVPLSVSPQAPALPTSPRPVPVPQSAPSIPSSVLEKSSSASNLSGRKTWTLRSKFKRSMSSSSNGPLNSASPKTSTFYLTPPVNVDTGVAENGLPSHSTDSLVENNEPTTPSSCSSSRTLCDNGSEGISPVDNVENNAKSRPLSSSSGRKGSGNVRPNSPPPLPPLPVADSTKKSSKKGKKISNTSWYTECGLFDQMDVQNTNNSDSVKKPKTDKPISNSWYAAVGLWDMSPPSQNDSSLSEHDTSQHTDVSDSSASQENYGVTQKLFLDEPLYQFYTANVVERAQWGVNSDFDSDGYEEIGDKGPKMPSRPSAMELIRPREGQHRTLWCEIPEVVNSQVLSTLSVHQKKLQEAKFEIITSEASYMNSLNVLEHHFMSSSELNDEAVLSKNDRRILFGNVLPVKNCSEQFLADLERCWQDNILLHGICDTIYQHATKHFSIYVKYCSNQIYLDRTLRRLKEQHGGFAEVLNHLEASPKCQSLSLHSFLMLPMQRITRLPLLIDAVLTRLDPKDDEYQTCELALATLNKVVQDCNEGARRMERMEEILILSRQLDFPREIKHVPIISSSRWLVRSGELIQLVWRGDDAKLTFGKKVSKITLHVFLFTDLLVITKKKSEECYTVVDHCPRNMVQVLSAEGMSHIPVKFSSDSGRNLMLLTMLQNHEKKTVEMVLSCPLESDRQRWLEAMSQPMSDNPDERVYEEWDCPQVTAIHPYTACQPDELSLDVSDVVNVLRKMSDGWYQGERIRDGERGWFPGNYTIEIASAHKRARNLKQRYRLLALSGNFLESLRKEKHAK
ncbi:uncharacterized protein Exn [Anabrus simplex]|uniref:uncharacterized protein Exn n=1 Tax=Anabrus simplex TaxID=316456 RepID=UPI0035A3B76A